jgi:hypothetical protein
MPERHWTTVWPRQPLRLKRVNKHSAEQCRTFCQALASSKLPHSRSSFALREEHYENRKRRNSGPFRRSNHA